jgi:hypothetical protein
MLKELNIHGVGPASKMDLVFGDRLNFITGDNGLGKSFLLDIAWWAMTRQWPRELNPKLASGYPAKPNSPKQASIGFKFTSKVTTEEYTSKFDMAQQAWTGRAGRPANPGLVIYALVDGSFAVWDPARNYWKKKGNIDVQDRPPAYVFSPTEIWNGLPNKTEDGGKFCNGLIEDWAGWQKEKGQPFHTLTSTLTKLSSEGDEKFSIGELTRISLDDSRDMPTLRMPYGESVPIVHASAGMRRIIALAYLLVWTWEEHVRASALIGQEPTKRMVFLIDEIEAHLHPRWQRKIVRSLINVVSDLISQPSVQIIATTHSPLVLSSVESLFDPKKDSWFDLDLIAASPEKPCVSLSNRAWVRHGDVSNWLMSEAFDLNSGRGDSDAEIAINEAAMALSDENIVPERVFALEKKLHAVLGDLDPFWNRWRFVGEKRGWFR